MSVLFPKSADCRTTNRLKGVFHISRGQRPRMRREKEFCPVRANQNWGCCVRHATISPHTQCTHHFFDERKASLVDQGCSGKSLGLSITDSPEPGMQFHYRWRRGRSCACALQSNQETRSDEGARNFEEGFVEVRKNIRGDVCGFSLAGWLWLVQPQSISCPGRARLYFESGAASQKRDISGGILEGAEKIRRGLRRTLFVGLNCRWDALSGRADLSHRRPRAVPSATMEQAFGLNQLSCKLRWRELQGFEIQGKKPDFIWTLKGGRA